MANKEDTFEKELKNIKIESKKAPFPDIDFELSYFGPVIGVHLGQGALALGWMQDTRKKPL